MKLRQIAHSRVEDTGVLVNISVIARDARDYPLLERTVTATRVRQQLAGLVRRTVVRYAQPHLGALNFVLWRAGGGRELRALAVPDASITHALLNLEVPELAVFHVRAVSHEDSSLTPIS